MSTSLHVDFGDGISVSYSNISRLGDSITHTYRVAGIFRVTARAQNSQGKDSSSVYLHITSMYMTAHIYFYKFEFSLRSYCHHCKKLFPVTLNYLYATHYTSRQFISEPSHNERCVEEEIAVVYGAKCDRY